jgi:alpha-tubulin suppressor-like RCC1 family protein
MYAYFNLVYTWGNISFKGSNIYKQAQPYPQPSQNIVSVSCGHSHVAAVDVYGDLFMLGSN